MTSKAEHTWRMRRAAAIALLMCLALTLAGPIQAWALTTERFTAKSNQDGGNEIMGATDTRITWQGQAADDERIAQVVLQLPPGTEIGDVKDTLLQGLERIDGPASITVNNADSTVTADFEEPTPAGSMIMLEMSGSKFPAEGGQYVVGGTYTTADGYAAEIPDGGKVVTVTGTSASEELAAWLSEQEWVKAWNSNKFLHLFFDPTIVVTSVPAIFWGWLVALALVACGFPLAIPLGLMWCFLRTAKHKVLRAIGSTYINVIRGTPLFLQIYIAFFGLPLLGLSLPNFLLGVIVMTLNSSAYLAEIFRAGIQSIPKGQFEAARSLGMNGAQTMVFVIIPQTFRRVIPTMTSEFILLYKDTSLLAAVGVMEIMMYSKTITAATGNVTPYIVAAFFYLIVTIPLTKVINVMEAKVNDLRPSKRRRAKLAQAADGQASEEGAAA